MTYKPPFTITPKIIDLISQISEALGRISILNEIKELKLRRINRIRTIQGSLAIEGNTLSEDQISTILEGKSVVAPLREVQEVRNAIKTYDAYPQWNPSRSEDLLTAHSLLMAGLVDVPGAYRTRGAGVMGKEQMVHVAPGAERVPSLMNDLLLWLDASEDHPLITSSVFHYEFEFIHPFEDGNGRMGRLWQTLILSRWNPLFHDIPVESMIYRRQKEYFKAINESSSIGQSTPFITFMLQTIHAEILEVQQNTTQENPQETTQEKILKLIEDKPESTRKQMALQLDMSPDGIKYHLDKMRKEGLIAHRGATKKGYWEILKNE